MLRRANITEILEFIVAALRGVCMCDVSLHNFWFIRKPVRSVAECTSR